MKYSEKLKDPRWQKLRLKIFERDNWTCSSCGNKKSMLSVHHRYYLKKTEPWDYPLDSFTTLCKECHQVEYEFRKDAEDNLLLLLKEKGFLCSDLEYLGSCLSLMILQDIPTKIADIYGWALDSPKIQRMLIDLWNEAANGKG